MIHDPQTYAIIGAAMRVHSELGMGFAEVVYQDALEVEFRLRRIPFEREYSIPLYYRETKLKSFFKADFVCFNSVIVELKYLKDLTEIEEAQVLNYLNATKMSRGLLINFGRKSLQYKRFVNGDIVEEKE
jgi:GxxExxY protein